MNLLKRLSKHTCVPLKQNKRSSTTKFKYRGNQVGKCMACLRMYVLDSEGRIAIHAPIEGGGRCMPYKSIPVIDGSKRCKKCHRLVLINKYDGYYIPHKKIRNGKSDCSGRVPY